MKKINLPLLEGACISKKRLQGKRDQQNMGQWMGKDASAIFETVWNVNASTLVKETIFS